MSAWKVFKSLPSHACQQCVDDSQASAQMSVKKIFWPGLNPIWFVCFGHLALNLKCPMHKCLFNEQSYFIIYFSALCLSASFQAGVFFFSENPIWWLSSKLSVYSKSGARHISVYWIPVTVSHVYCHSLSASLWLLHQRNEWERSSEMGPRGEKRY